MSAGTSRTIWFCWLQGLDAAPPLVRACHESWVRQNPDWTVRVLDDATIPEFVDLPAWTRDLTPQQFSDILRLTLLESHGGVWADATSYCNWPLDRWLPDHLGGGFFAFAEPHPGQTLDSWFLAVAAPGNVLVQSTLRFLSEYFRQIAGHNAGTMPVLARRLLYAALTRSTRTSEWWFSRPLRMLKWVPYYAIHYAFNRVIRTDPAARAVWIGGRHWPAREAFKIHNYGYDRRPDAAMSAELAAPTEPVYKLSWKAADALADPESVLARLVSPGR